MDYVPLSEATAEVPKRHGRKCSVHLLWRWCRQGVKARDGQRVFLEHIRLGGVILIPRGAIEVFGKALAEADQQYFHHQQAQANAFVKARAENPAPDRRREREVQRAAEALDQDGI